MTNKIPAFLLVLISIIFLNSCEMPNNSNNGNSGKPIDLNYPLTQMDTTVVDTYFGEIVKDPYRWLEDDHSEETKAWVTAQNDLTFKYLNNIPYRKKIADRLEELWDYEKFSTPFKEGDAYYYFRNSGLQNQSVMYGTKNLEEEAQVILDPNTFSEDGTSSLAGFGFSEDGKHLAYGISEGGSDWRTIYVKNLENGEKLSDEIKWVKFSGISWFKDGFFYSRYPEPKENDELSGSNKFHAMYYHKLGTSQDKDELVYSNRQNPKTNVYGGVSEDKQFLVISTSTTTRGNKLYFKNLSKNEASFTPIVENEENDFWFIDNIDKNLLVLTNYKAPNYRLVSINTNKSGEDFWEEIIPESENVLESISLAGGNLVARYLKDATSVLKVLDYSGKFIYDIELPTVGTVGGFSSKADENIAFYSFTSFNYPTTIFKYDLKSKESTVFKKPTIKNFNPEDYESKQIFYSSKDGTKVPMFIVYKKGTDITSGDNPTLLYGYGGFNISIKPSFSISRLALLEAGGIYASANIRGGGEYGQKWHDGGRLDKKQNVFDDFIAAAEYLIENKYTSKEKLAIEGRSNGGLLVGACMTQRPDLFKVAFPGVGVLDMLRYHEFTIGRAWAADYGLSTDSLQFRYLINYSPLHNVEAGVNYPATMVTTADHDDRVVPAHSFKFISELQKNHEGDHPVLIRIDVSAGHGAGKPTKMVIEEIADRMAFMLYNMDEDYQ